MFYESVIAQEMVHVLEHVENDVSSIFKLTFHWYDVYRNRLHQLSDNNKKLRVFAVLRACLSVCNIETPQPDFASGSLSA